MKIYLILFTLFFSFKVVSQNNLAIYEVLFKVENEKRSSEFFNLISEASKNLEYELIFNDNESQFSISRKLNLEGINLAASKIISKGVYYFTKKQNENYIINENVFYKKELISDWKFHNEQKIINNYTCFKATTIKKVVNYKGTFNHAITAWYCPEIPFGFGPNGYNGLPGLIFELIESPANHFVIRSINLKKQNKENFIDLKKYEEIKEEDYVKKIKSNLPSK